MTPQTQQPQTTSADVALEGGWPVATVLLNGQPFRFMVDTAAGGGVVDDGVADRLQMTKTSGAAVVGATSAGRSGTATASTVEFVGRTRTSEDFVVTDMSQFPATFEGIIGNHFTKHYAFTMDVPRGRLELSDADRSASAADMTCVPNALPGRNDAMAGFAIVRASLMSPGTAQPVSVLAVIDSGAQRTQLNWAAGRALGLAPGDARLTERGASRGLNATTQGPASYSYALERFEIASWLVPTTQVRINDLSVFRALGLADEPALILGADILNQRAFSISKGAAEFCVGAA